MTNRISLHIASVIITLWSFPSLFAIGAGSVPFSSVNPTTIVETVDQVDEIDTRYNVAKILFWNPDTLSDAYQHLKAIWKKAPQKSEIKLLYARMMLKIQNFSKANELADSLMHVKTHDVYTLIDLAGFQAELGNAAISRDLFVQIKPLLTEETDKFYEENLAKSQELWGDWVESELALTPLITSSNHPYQHKMDLATLFQRSHKLPQAEEIYLESIAHDPKSTAPFELIQLKISENDFQYASDLIESIPKDQQKHKMYSFLLGEVAIKLKDYQRASDIFVDLAQTTDFPPQKSEFLIRAAIAKFKAEEFDEAQQLFQQANSYNPHAVKPHFYLHILNYGYEGFVCELLDLDLPPQELKELAICFQDEGRISEAIDLLKPTVENYPDYFPASWMLAELYATAYIYEAAWQIYNSLAEEFPNSQMILLQKARCLSWMKLYRRSLCLYKELINQDISNQQFALEKARVALLDHNPFLARASYQSLLGNASSDFYLACLLCNFPQKEEAKEYWNGQLYNNYKNNWALYLIQKQTYLEMQAKFALWENLPFTAIEKYQDWLTYSPGNMEALFEYGQVVQGLGLNDPVALIYDEIIDINRNYSIANSARQRINYIETPKLADNLSIWAEEGYGVLSQITRRKFYTGIEYPLDGQTQVSLNYYIFSDHPYNGGGEYNFQSLGITYDQVFNENTSIKAVLLPKIASNYRLKYYFIGNLLAKYRFNDTVILSVGADITDEFYNRFGIQQGIQGDAVWGKIAWETTRKLHIEAIYKYLNYTDKNNLNVVAGSIDYQVTEYPKVLKLSLQGEYRNTAKTNIYIYERTELVDIIHPYWSAQDYYAGRFVVEWNHNLTFIDFIGSEKTRYTIRAMVGDDTDNNWAGSLTAEFHYDWGDRWSFQITTLGHYSHLWKAAGLWSNISYAF